MRCAGRGVETAVGLDGDRHRLSRLDGTRQNAPHRAARRDPRSSARRSRRPRSGSPCPPAPARAVRTTSAASPLGATTSFASPFAVSKLCAFGSPSTASRSFASFRSRESPTAQIPAAIAATAATAAAVDRTGSVNRRRSGTTFGRSLRACSRILAAERGGRLRAAGRTAERCGDLPEPLQLVAARLTRGEVRLVALAARPDPARRARSRRSVRVGPRRLHSLIQKLAQAREPGEHSALDRAERLPETLGELRLRIAAVVGELDRLALLVGQCWSAVCTRSRSSRSHAASSAEPSDGSGAPSSGSVRRRCSRRTRSTARRCTSVRIQVDAFARSGMNEPALRQSPRNASCTASSASASSRSTRYASPYAVPPIRS